MSRSLNPNKLLAGAAITFVVTLALQLIPLLAADGVQEKPASVSAQTQADADKKSVGCLTCHTPDAASMHPTAVRAGCTDCHGGNAGASRDKSIAKGSPQFLDIQRQAHVQPKLDIWKTAANPASIWYETLGETAEFIRFVNPGDLRVARESCGQCHDEETRNRREEHDAPRRHAVGRGALQQRRVSLQELAVRRVLHARWHARHRLHGAAAVAGNDQGRRASFRSCSRSSRGRSRSRATSSASSRRAARSSLKSAIPKSSKSLADRAAPERPRPGHAEPHRPGVHRPAEDAPARPDAQLHGHERPARRLPSRRLHRRATSSMPTTARRCTRPRPMRRPATRASRRPPTR